VTTLGVWLGLTIVGWAGARRAWGCTYSFPPYVTDPAESGVDTQVPAAPSVGKVTIKRGMGPRGSGCQSTSSSCDDIGAITLRLTAKDDRTAADAIGYTISVVRGQAPEDLSPLDQPLAQVGTNEVTLIWLDGGTNDQEAVDFDLRVRAIDKAGNVGPGTLVPIQSGSTGCSVSPGARVVRLDRPLALALAAALSLGMLLTRRRRRPGRVASPGWGPG